MKQNGVKKANALNVCENVRELNAKSQTLVSIKNVFKFMAVCAGAGLLVFGGAYELDANGVDIVGQWFYTD